MYAIEDVAFNRQELSIDMNGWPKVSENEVMTLYYAWGLCFCAFEVFHLSYADQMPVQPRYVEGMHCRRLHLSR